MRLSFKAKLSIYFIIVILITALPIGGLAYNYFYEYQKKTISSASYNEISRIDVEMNNLFSSIKENCEYLSKNSRIIMADNTVLPVFDLNKKNISKKYSKYIGGNETLIYNELEKYALTHSDSDYVYMGTKWGGYIQWPDGLEAASYDPRLRPWYLNAINNPDKAVISEPYISFDSTHAVIVSISTTIRDNNGEIIGVVGIDVSLKKLSEIISKIKIGKSGYIFIYEKNGTILAHPDSDLIFQNIDDLDIKNSINSKTTAQNLISSKNNNLPFFQGNVNGKTSLIDIYSSPVTDWKIASVVPISDLNSSANEIGLFIMLLTLLIMAGAIIITIYSAGKITKPIEKLALLMHKAGNGDLTVRAKVGSNDEFGLISKSFNTMIEKLYNSNEEIALTHEELLSTEENLRQQYIELQISEEKFKLALDGANDSLWEWDLINEDFLISDKFYELTGYKKINKLSRKTFLNDFVYPDDMKKVKKELLAHLNLQSSFYKSEFRLKKSDGSYVWVYNRGKAQFNKSGTPIRIAGSLTDITEIKKNEEKISYMAYHDQLTGLPNRGHFINKLEGKLNKCDGSIESHGLIAFIDLDNFKDINDSFGHNFGDKLLIAFADEIKANISTNDIICRIGGDEFIIQHSFSKNEDENRFSSILLSILEKPLKVEGKKICITASIGIAVYPRHGNSSTVLLKNADTAMYKAKEQGKNTYAVFDFSMFQMLERRTQIDRILRNSIENGELYVNYQPQYAASTRKILGFEALLRLNSHELGFISPMEFIPIAEETGYIEKIGHFVLRESCKTAVELKNKGYKFGTMSVNISSVQIKQPNFIKKISEILNETGLNYESLELEITETVLMGNFDLNVKRLSELKSKGIRIALDDFGTGYSSLNYLKSIPLDTLKIDKCFVDSMILNNKEKSIIETIITMAHIRNLKVVAEGVETETQLEMLNNMNCDIIQGYVFSKPLPVDKIDQLFEK